MQTKLYRYSTRDLEREKPVALHILSMIILTVRVTSKRIHYSNSCSQSVIPPSNLQKLQHFLEIPKAVTLPFAKRNDLKIERNALLVGRTMCIIHTHATVQYG